MRVIEVSLPDTLAAFAAEQAAAAGHASIGDYVVALLRQAQREKAEAELERLLGPATEALDRGEGKEMTEADWEELRRRIREKPRRPTVS